MSKQWDKEDFSESHLIGLPPSKEKIKQREYDRGQRAKQEGKPRTFCPWDTGENREWWLSGYDTLSMK